MPAYEFVTDILRPYLEDTKRSKKPRTVETDAGAARLLEEHFRGTWLSAVVTGTMLSRRFVKGVIRELEEDYSTPWVHRIIAVASAACNYAQKEYSYDIPNPFANQTKPGLVKRERVLSQGEAKRLLLACGPWLREIVLFALHTGFRVTEILDLTWARVEGDTAIFRPADQKSGKDRRRALNASALAIIARQPKCKPEVFTLDGSRLQRRKLHSLWREAVARAEITDLIFHDLRRSCGQWMLDAGASMEAVQAQLGHEDVKTTQSAYVSPSLGLAKSAVSKLWGEFSDGAENSVLSA